MKKIFKAMAIIGVLLAFGAIGTMDFYTKELISDFPMCCYIMLFGGISMTLPALVYGILESGK